MIGTRSNKGLHAGPNMTPMVDVVMCILIFFMLGSSFLLPEWPIAAPLAKQIVVPPTTTEKRAVSLPAVQMWVKLIRRGDETWVKAFGAAERKMDAIDAVDQAGNLQLAEFFLKKGESFSPDVQVLISPQGEVPYQDLITVYEWCLKAKMRQVAFTL